MSLGGKNTNEGLDSKALEKSDKTNIQYLKNIKSNFIFKKICNNLNKEKAMKIFNYNKSLQKKLNLSLDDYKELSKIEIELEVLHEEKLIKKKNYFINYHREDLSSFYHIFLMKIKMKREETII